MLVDQITKILAVQQLSDRAPVEILGDFFMLTLVYNQAGAMGTNLGSSAYYLIVAILIIPFILYYLYQYRRVPLLSLPLALIAGGAIGNIIDRIRLGKVIDFLDFDFFDIDLFGYHLTRWWVFNVADAAISVGIVVLILVTLFGHKALREPRQTEESGLKTGGAVDE